MALKSKSFGDLLTFTRATGGGRFNASGQYEWLSAGQPRFDFDPVTLEPRGILIEEQRTNLLLRSAEFLSAPWIVPFQFGTSGNRAALVDGSAAVAPDGSMTAFFFHEGAASYGVSEHYLDQPIPSPVAAGTYTYTIFAKAASRTSVAVRPVHSGNITATSEVRFDLLTGSSSTSSSLVKSRSAIAAGGGWWRLSVTVELPAASTYFGFRVQHYKTDGNNSFIGDGTSGLYIWGAQLEVGAFPTSYIPTTTAQVTRAADLCSVDTLSPWYRADEGTLMVDWNLPVNTSDNNQLAAFGSVAGSSMAIRMGGNSGRRVRAFAQDASGVFQFAVDCPVEASRTTGKSAFAYKLKDDFAASSAGSLDKDVSGDISDLSVDTLRVGRNGGTYANGHILRIRYIPRRISDTELQALTAL